MDDGIIVYTNPRFEEMFGYDSGELTGKHISIVNAPTDKNPEEKAKGIMEVLEETGEWHGEVNNIKKDGTPFWCYANVSAFDHPVYGKVTVAIHTDITERKKAEKNIIDLAKFPSENPNPVLRVAKEKVIYINKAGEKLFNIIEGESVPLLILDTVNEVISVKEIKSVEIEHGNLTYSYIITPVEAEDYVNIYGRNITERKKAEDDLKRIMDDLKRSNEELEQFAYVASHDLQEPLRMVASFTQLLQTRYQDKLDDDANDFINYAVDGANRMQSLIKDLLIFSRVGTRGKPFKATDMNVILQDVLENIMQSTKETDATITNDPLPVVIADNSQMIQLLQNLISNTIKFHGDEPPRIHVSGEVKVNEWIFSVKDNGIGIDSKYFEKIFVIFQRLHKKEKYQGTGIGLAVCKKIVQRHGGKMWVESELGKGSTFYFTINKTEAIKE